jgi:hypothetical protein
MSDWKERLAFTTTGRGHARARLGRSAGGMDDYEFYLTIKKSGKDKLIVALLEKLYGNNDSCTKEFEELMRKNGIPCERYVV